MQLQLLQAINQAKSYPQAAISVVESDLAALRRQLVLADSLIYKLILNAMIARDIQTLVLLEQKYVLTTSEIARLSPNEKSFGLAFKYELAFQDKILTNMSPDGDEGELFSQWISEIRYFFFLIKI